MLDRLQSSLRTSGADVRWAAVSSIHLTLKFLGEVDPAVIPKLAESLREASASEQSLMLRLHSLGCFPDQKNPKVIWCGVDGDIDRLGLLQTKVNKVCNNLGFPSEDRPFHPHLTLGRVKGKRNLQRLLEYIKIGSDLECSFRAGGYNIYRSTLTPRGAIYSAIETIDLIDDLRLTIDD